VAVKKLCFVLLICAAICPIGAYAMDGYQINRRALIPQSTNAGASAAHGAMKITAIGKTGCPGACAVAITWEAPTVDQYGNACTIATYKVYRGVFQPSNVSERLIATVNAPTVTYTDSTAMTQINGHAVDYFWRIYACSAANVCSYWKQIPKNHSNKIQWQTSGTDWYGSFRLLRRDYPGDSVSAFAKLDGLNTFDADNFVTGGADQNTALILRYARGNDYIEQAYTLADASNDSVNVPSTATKATVPNPTASGGGNEINVSWPAAGGSISGYKISRNGILIATTTDTSITNDISSLTANLKSCGAVGVGYGLQLLFSDGTTFGGTSSNTLFRNDSQPAITATQNGQNADLSWTAGSGSIDHYEVIRNWWVENPPGGGTYYWNHRTSANTSALSFTDDISDIPATHHVWWYLTIHFSDSSICGPLDGPMIQKQ
jgi:hypothetical protein